MKEKRIVRTMKKQFVTRPGDVFTIKVRSNLLSNVIDVEVKNERVGENFTLTFKNAEDSWDLFKKLNDMLARKVFYKVDDEEPIPFEDSPPYKSRFGAGDG